MPTPPRWALPPQRCTKATRRWKRRSWKVDRLLKSTGEREISTTMAFAQALNMVLREAGGPALVPIVADEARTFGMEGLFARSASTPRTARSTSRSTATS
jgi:pyruvate dehydrogenase complex dehydrogenase (E1) component